MCDVRVQYPAKSRRKLGCRDVFTVRVWNKGRRELPIIRVTLTPSVYHRFAMTTLGPIPPQQWVEKELQVEVQHPGRPNVRHLCQELQLEVGDQTYKQEVKVANYNRGLIDYSPQRVGADESELSQFNILMFGAAGASKSSFMNTVLTMLQEPEQSKLYRIAGVGGGARHATRRLFCYQVFKTFPDVKFNLWDTWGLDENSYTDELVCTLVDGKLPKRWKMNMKWSQYKQRFEEMPEKIATQMHAIVFFVPQAMLTDIDDEETARIQKMFQVLTDKLYTPLVILTKVDEVCPTIRADPLSTQKEVEELRQKTATLFRIGLNNVHYTVNYTVESERTFGIEALAYENIELALQHCESFVQARIMRYGSVKETGVVDKDGFIWPGDSDDD